MLTSDSRVAVVVLSCNEGLDLRECLAGVLSQQVGCSLEVLVIDSGSVDGSPEVARAFPAVHLLQIAPAEFNHGTTRNLGAASTTGEFIVFLNGHVWPADEHWLSSLLVPFAWDPRIAGVYSRQLPKPGCNPALAANALYWPPIARIQSFVGLSETEIRRHLRELVFFSTVSCAIRRSVWEQIPFQDDIPIMEDQGWSKRALEAGYSLVYEPASRALHSHNYSPRQYYRRAYLLRQQLARILNLRPSAAEILVAFPARVLWDVARDAVLMHTNGQLSPGALLGSLALRTANSLAVTRADWEARQMRVGARMADESGFAVVAVNDSGSRPTSLIKSGYCFTLPGAGREVLVATQTARVLASNDLHKYPITICHRPLPVQVGKPSMFALPFAEAGYRVTEVADGRLDLDPNGILLIAGNPNWYPVICRQLTHTPRSERPLIVIWHIEPFPPSKASGLPWPRLHLREIAKILLRSKRATDVYTNYLLLRRLAQQGLADLIAVTTLGRHEFLVEQGMAAHWVPLGYVPSDGHDMGLSRDIDALFLGTRDVPRRNRQLERLRRNGINVAIVGSWSNPAYWGENRTLLLNRTKILLNISRHPGNLSDLRLIRGMANKALVVAEPIYKPAPFVPGRHYVSATVEEMPDVIRYYLAHDDERQCIVDEGYRLVTQEATMVNSVRRLMELLRQHGQ